MGRDFVLTWPQWQPPPEAGVVVLATHAEATFGWAEAQLAQDSDGFWAWTSGGATPEKRALALLDRPGVVAATLAPARADVRRVGLALDVGAWLGRRAESPREGSPAAHLTSFHPPAVPPGAVRIPHLITVRRGDHVVTDEVVWEVVPTTAALQRLGELPDLTLVERNLTKLLRLRAAARAGRLPMTAAAGRLVALLNGGDLSIELVLQRFDLFRVLLFGARDHPV